MATSTSIKIKGDSLVLLKRKLNKLAKKDIKKITRASVSKAMTPMMQAVRKNAPKQQAVLTGKQKRKDLNRAIKDAANKAKAHGTWAAGNFKNEIGFGALKKSIGKKVKAFKHTIGSWVGPRTKFKVLGGSGKTGTKVPAWYAHLVEGVRTKAKAHKIRTPWPDGVMKTVNHPGVVNNTPFTKRSAETTTAKTKKILKTELKNRIIKAAKVGI
jgi:hypothetical protein